MKVLLYILFVAFRNINQQNAKEGYIWNGKNILPTYCRHTVSKIHRSEQTGLMARHPHLLPDPAAVAARPIEMVKNKP